MNCYFKNCGCDNEAKWWIVKELSSGICKNFEVAGLCKKCFLHWHPKLKQQFKYLRVFLSEKEATDYKNKIMLLK